MGGLFTPFVRLLTVRKPVISRGSILFILIKLAFLKRIHSNKSPVKIRLGKLIIHSPSYDLLSFLIKEKFVNEEYRFSSSSVSPLIIDCGAGIGISMLYFKSLYPDAEIHCFEPFAGSIPFLEKNISENKLTGIYHYQKALAATSGTRELFIPALRPSLNAGLYQQSGTSAVVQTIPLSEFLLQFQKVDLIKIDTEGAEKEIVPELDLHKKIVKAFIIECHYQVFESLGAVQAFGQLFEDAGYSVVLEPFYPKNPQSDLLLTAINSSKHVLDLS